MLMITRKETWIPFYAIILFFIIKNYRSKWWIVVLFLAIDVLLADQISVLFKETFQRLRPVHNPEIEHLVHNVLRKGGLYGFVSSHAANAFAIMAFLTYLFRNRGFWVLMFFWSLIFCYSRIYSGVHYPFDIFAGAVDVVVCDGFVGNIVLKLSEGLADAAGRMLKREIVKSWVSKIGYLFVRGAFDRFKKIVDYAEYGGAPLLGINGVGMICHGGSSVKALKNAIRFAHEYAKNGVSEHVVEKLSENHSVLTRSDSLPITTAE